MRFAVYFLAFLLFICSWNLGQVFGARTITLVAKECGLNDKICIVEAQVTAPDDQNTAKHEEGVPVARRFPVLRELIGKPDENLSMAVPGRVKGHSSSCLEDFCVAIESEPKTPSVIKMSHANPLIKGNPDVKMNPATGTEEVIILDAQAAPEVPDYDDLATIKYKCDGRTCYYNITVTGGPGAEFIMPLGLNDLNAPMSSTTFHALNGLVHCVDTYCAFLGKNQKEFFYNFDGNFYANTKPQKALNGTRRTNVTEVEKLIPFNIVSQVEVAFTLKGGNSTLECSYSSPSSTNPPILSMPIPKNVTLNHLKPVRRFKAGNGVGACAGKHCCFKKDTDHTQLYVNFPGNINTTRTLPDWASQSDDKPITNVEKYSGFTDHALFPSTSDSANTFITTVSVGVSMVVAAVSYFGVFA